MGGGGGGGGGRAVGAGVTHHRMFQTDSCFSEWDRIRVYIRTKLAMDTIRRL